VVLAGGEQHDPLARPQSLRRTSVPLIDPFMIHFGTVA
jgi:hypothetical protein